MLGNPVLMGVVLGVNVVVLFAVGFWARGRTETSEDYLVAGRRLGIPLATATLFATWFGAGTLLVATQEVRVEGLRAAALDPLGAGVCLIVAGAFFAAPLWRMKLLTIVDFYRVRFGPRAEKLAAVLMVPGYFGWIAAQFVALASVLQLLLRPRLHRGPRARGGGRDGLHADRRHVVGGRDRRPAGGAAHHRPRRDGGDGAPRRWATATRWRARSGSCTRRPRASS